jgi:IK cytokine
MLFVINLNLKISELKSEDNVLAELSEKYRDRAKERREGSGQDFAQDARNSTSGYRAVAPDLKLDTAERRKELIQQSKFLGGDLEHTHLVKGLDYALLQKVKSEIQHQEQIQEEEIEKMIDEKILERNEKNIEKIEKEDESQIKSVMGKNIHRWITIQNSKNIERNEMFFPGRMAYNFEFEDENVETDIPTTLIRSKTELMGSVDLNTLSTNDIVVNKLTQIFSYLRQGGKKKNKKKSEKETFKMPEEVEKPSSSSKSSRSRVEDNIYGEDIGEYKPTRSSKEYERSDRDRDRRDKDRHRDRDRERDRDRRHYDRNDDYGHSSKSSSSSNSKSKRGSYFDKKDEVEIETGTINIPAPPKLSSQLLSKLHDNEPDSYAECYPGLEEMDDAIIDSDDEADFSKMDNGNKKGPIGRWDFDTQEEYSEYMSTKEALPKAAFQYGLKMSDGRKTRKNKSDIQKVDQEWQKIQKIITKRKAEASAAEESAFKKSKN